MPEFKDVSQAIARWSGLLGGILTFILGIVHIATSDARIRWPDQFTEDVNALFWRARLFSFSPEVFVDAWTPVVFGLVAILCHFEQFKLQKIAGNFMKFFIFNLVMALFATMAYCGGLGILFSIPVWVCCLASLIAFFLSEDGDRADLQLSFKRN